MIATLHRATRAIALALVLIALNGCADRPDDRRTALLAPDLQFRAPLPRELGRSVKVTQLVTARYQGETFAFQAYLSVSPDSLTLVAIDAFGRRAMTLALTDAGVTSEIASWVPNFIRPENIVADITIVYWPVEAIRGGLASGTAIVRTDTRHRVISYKGADIVDIHYDGSGDGGWSGSVQFRNRAFGYELDLRSAVVE